MLKSLREKLGQLSASAKSEITKFKNREMLDAIIAGCATIAYADGSLEPSEKQKMVKAIQLNDALKVFDANDIIKSFNKASESFEFDFQMGLANNLQTIAKIKGKEEQAKLLVRICCIIGAADGNFDDNEKNATRKICQELGLDPKDFDL